MPPTSKRQKTLAAAARSRLAPTHRSIAAFGKISKSQLQPQLCKTETSHKDILDYQKVEGAVIRRESCVRKRKLEDVLETPLEEAVSKDRKRKAIDSEKKLADPSLLPVSLNSVTTRKEVAVKASAKETPTKGARACLESIALASSSPSSLPSSPSPSLKNTPPTSPTSVQSSFLLSSKPSELPDEVLDLIDLHSAFLTALSLHFAHHGSLAPADLRQLTPSIERSWGKRRINLDDIKRILATPEKPSNENYNFTWDETPCPFHLSDYGNGKICVELADNTHPKTAHEQPINISALTARFANQIHHQWTASSPSSPTTFISTLPLAPLTPCSSLPLLHPLFSKGQRLLSDLKAGAIKAQQTTTNTPPTLDPSQPHPPSRPKLLATRTSSLLSRIRAKQLRQTLLPCAPSAALLSRRAALQRLPEITPVLDLLAGLGTRSLANPSLSSTTNQDRTFSFTMPTVVQHLQMSLRNPISKEEAMQCMALLAEVAPEWIGVRDVGKVKGVMVRGGMGARREEVGERVRKALEESG